MSHYCNKKKKSFLGNKNIICTKGDLWELPVAQYKQFCVGDKAILIF